MNNRKYRQTATALALLVAVAASGCTKSSSSGTDASPSASAGASKSPSASAPSAPAKTVNLQVFSMPTNFSGAVTGWWSDVLKEKVGVKLEILPSGDQGEQKLQALMAGGELPDIVVFKTQQQVADAVKANLLVNLDEYIAKLPNAAKNASTALQYYRDTASNGTGKLYAIPNNVGPALIGAELNYGPYLRWDLYKQLGMPEVNKVEDYLPLLKKMQDLEPKNKDGQKTYGFTLWKDWDSIAMLLSGMPLTGIDSGDPSLPFLQVNYLNNETKSILAPDSEYIRMLKFYYTANQMGLVDPDSLTQRYESALEKANQGRVLLSWWPWFSGGYNTAHVNDDPVKGFRPVFSKDMRPFKPGDAPFGETWAIGIGKSTKNLDAALAYVDFNYSFEGNQLLINGPKGVIWDLDSKGQQYVTDQGWDILTNNKDMPGGGKLVDAYSAVRSSGGLSAATIDPTYKQPIHYGIWPSTLQHNPNKLDQDWQKTTGYKTTVAMLEDKKLTSSNSLASKLIPTMSDDMTTLKNKIGDVVKTDSWLAVFAKNDAEFQKIVDDMRKKAEGLGLQKLLDLGNANWKTALENAKKYNK
ncbi:MAG: extracellular solute-binding protein [Paenibacillaceae bacterium]|nr:extracellular solute-binding protein [Paenibacillaceae bacterium]